MPLMTLQAVADVGRRAKTVDARVVIDRNAAERAVATESAQSTSFVKLAPGLPAR
jgi:hypothetical protein